MHWCNPISLISKLSGEGMNGDLKVHFYGMTDYREGKPAVYDFLRLADCGTGISLIKYRNVFNDFFGYL